jgi:hypothetical protein
MRLKSLVMAPPSTLRLAGALGFAVALAGCASRPPPPSGPGGFAGDRLELPAVEVRRFLLVDCRINGAGPFRLLVDSGARGLVLTTDAAARAGVAVAAQSGAAGFAGQAAVLQAGGLRLERVPADLLPPAELVRLHRLIGPCDGFLGLGVFRGFVLELDFAGARVALLRPAAARYPAWAMVAYAGERPVVPIQVCGRTERALIDTGSNFFLILPHFDSYPVRRLVAAAPGAHPGAFALDFARSGELAGEVRVGPAAWRHPAVREQRLGEEANLGLLAFADWKLAFEPAAHRIYFLPADAPPAPAVLEAPPG